MCNPAVLEFLGQHSFTILRPRILEVGSRNINGSARNLLAPTASEYIGVDIETGDGVDEIVDAVDLVSHFGPKSFDWVVSTEMLEHCKPWRGAIQAMKSVLRPTGKILLTARSPGFGRHNPPDYWRFTPVDMVRIFSDFDVLACQPDPTPRRPGVFLAAIKPLQWSPTDLSQIEVASVE